MTTILVVESGTGTATANSYISLTDANTYHSLRGNSKWNDWSDEKKEYAIIRSTDYIDARFGRRFRGFRLLTYQPLEWPRLDAFDDDGFLLGFAGQLPKQLVKATAEYALRALLYNVLAPDPTLITPPQSMETGVVELTQDDMPGGTVISRTSKVGPIEQTIRYQTRAQMEGGVETSRSVQSSLVSDENIPEYPQADILIEWLLRNTNEAASLVRGD